MDEPVVAAPKRIMLATDLSCRCDRALDRARRLARDWKATLVLVHVMEPGLADRIRTDPDVPSWRRTGDPATKMRHQIWRDLAGDMADVDVRVVEGEAAEQLLAVAAEERCDLIVTGVARDGILGPMVLGTTVNKLVRHAEVPVLIVRNRVNRPYGKIVVGTDFSDSSARALTTAAKWFPTAEYVLFHGYDIPFDDLLDKDEFGRQLAAMEERCKADFLAKTPLDDAVRERVHLLIEHGNPERLLWDYVTDQEADLTVIGSHGRSAFFDVLIGSMTKRLLESAQGDTLVVRRPRTR
ncbi:universal stress protein [Sphingomonas sp. MM-1]|uniref:universal stress protein n=1 Tax=Sphingomonas sp. MM-1 TaxID=745310 RepID=UPI000A5B2C34|nr:universal stress protein [Sphingomonas sp. MM-1]